MCHNLGTMLLEVLQEEICKLVNRSEGDNIYLHNYAYAGCVKTKIGAEETGVHTRITKMIRNGNGNLGCEKFNDGCFWGWEVGGGHDGVGYHGGGGIRQGSDV